MRKYLHAAAAASDVDLPGWLGDPSNGYLSATAATGAAAQMMADP